MRTILLEVITPEKVIYTGQVSSIVCLSEEGELGILPGHAELVARLRPGDIRMIEAGGAKKHVAIGGGFLEVRRDKVAILAER